MKKIIVLDFGSPTTQSIAREIRGLGVYSEIYPYNKFPENDPDVIGVILSDSPYSLNDPKAFKPDLSGIYGKYPIAGMNYGARYLADYAVGKTETERVNMQQYVGNIFFMAKKIEGENTHWNESVFWNPPITALLPHFCKFCGAEQNWTPALFIESTVQNLKEQLGNDKVVLGLSGGVDSSVVAVLLNKAIGKNLICIFVDQGLLRKGEFEKVLSDYQGLGLNVIGVDAKEKFYHELAGITDPEQKRKIIGKGFIDVFDEEASKLEGVKWLGQGTIYPDIIESVSVTGKTIKSHHNVGGLPEKMGLSLVEPLRQLFKDEVRKVGIEFGMPEHLIKRHPFPGPGLGIRILGDITPEKVRILQEADDIFISALRKCNLYDKVWQAGVILLPVQSVGITNDERTYEYAVALRAVNSIDAMTAKWVCLPYCFLAKVSNDIINNVKGVNRVVYDISSKPPATIEWE